MSGLLVLASALGLETLPAAVARSRARLAPSGLARTAGITSVVSLLLVEIAAVVCALPLVAALLGGEPGAHFFPGGQVAGVVSAAVALILPIRVAQVFVQVRRQRRRLRPEAWLGTHVSLGEMELVVVPTEEKLAFALPGQTPQVVISRGALQSLEPDEVLSIIRHERAHLAHHHTLYLALVSVLSPLTRVPVVGDSMRSLPGWLERWADDEAAETATERSRVRNVLRSLAVTDYGAAAASMAPRGTVSDRLAALEEEPTPTSRFAAIGVLVLTAVVAGIGLVPLLGRLL